MYPQHSEFLLPHVLFQGQQALFDAESRGCPFGGTKDNKDRLEEDPDLAGCALGFRLKEGCSLVIMDF